MLSTERHGERTTTLIGVGAAGFNFVVFVLVGTIVLQDPTYGGVMGLFAGVGSYFFLPSFLGLAGAAESTVEERGPGEVIEQAGGSPRLAVAGAGLEVAAIVMLVVALSPVEETVVAGVTAGVATAVAVALVGGGILSRT